MNTENQSNVAREEESAREYSELRKPVCLYNKQEHLKMIMMELIDSVDSLKGMQDVRELFVNLQIATEQRMTRKFNEVISKQQEDLKKYKAVIEMVKSL